jgi:hypothetical protein
MAVVWFIAARRFFVFSGLCIDSESRPALVSIGPKYLRLQAQAVWAILL